MTQLLSVGPETPAEDESKIAKGYSVTASASVVMAIPFGVAWFADTKWVVAAGIAMAVAMAGSLESRLFDLCIRIRRTNILLTAIRDSRP